MRRALILLPLLFGCSETSVRLLHFERTAVVTGDFDSVGELIDGLADVVEVDDLHAYDGWIAGPAEPSGVEAPEHTVEQLFANEGPRRLSEYDALFLPCGMRGVGEHRHDDGAPDDHLIRDLDLLYALRDAVEAGLHLYVSDWSYEWIWLMFEDRATWVGEQRLDDAQRGLAGGWDAYVVEPELADLLGREPGEVIDLTMNQSGWALASSVPEDVDVLVQADVQYDDPESGVPRWLREVPLAFTFEVGQGRVVYTAFHHGNQVGQDGQVLLQRLLGLLAEDE